MTIYLLNGEIAETPEKLTDRIKVAVPNLGQMTRAVYGPLAFRPVVSGHGGTRLPHAGDKAVLGVDEGTGEQWIVEWHRDDDTPPPYTEEPSGGGGAGGGAYYSTAIGNGVLKDFVISHGLGTKNVTVSVYRNSAPYDQIYADVERTTANSVTVRTLDAPSTGEYVVSVNGPGQPAVGGGDANYVHDQASAAPTWNVNHNLNKFPSVSVVDSGGNVIIPDVHYINTASLTIAFGGATSGKAYVN